MRSTLFSILTLLFLSHSNAQTLTGSELLEKAIAYHDPNTNWPNFSGQLNITMKMPDGSERVSEIKINLPKEFFQATSTKDSVELKRTVIKGQCELEINGSSTFSEEAQKEHKMTCDRAKMYKNYYTYLYGLPMKLKDPGTIIHQETQRKTFNGKEYLVLKATYEKEVGGDIWYFYFNPETYAMEIYQFFRDESIPDGEYILLTDEEEVSGIKMPKTRAWYYNKDDKHLGTDVLTSGKSF